MEIQNWISAIVLLIIFTGIFSFLFILERRIKKLEKKSQDKDA